MQQYTQSVKAFITKHKKALSIGAGIFVVAAIIAGGVAYSIATDPHRVVYQPTRACDLFTDSEAQTLLGDKKAINRVQDPVVSGDTAASSCSYSDTNPDENAMKVAAMIVRSGVNDFGVTQNQTDFANKRKQTADIEVVTGIGDTAFFDKATGQLNVLKGRDSFLMSYGVGTKPTENTVDDAVAFAHLVLN
jgi:hypothetical protein